MSLSFFVHVSEAAKDVYSDILVNLAWVLIVAMPDYIIVHDWLRLTNSFFQSILIMRIAIRLRKKAHE